MTAASDPALLSLEDWFALGEDESLRRAELCQGVLEVSPSPRRAHSGALLAIARQLQAQLPSNHEAYHELDMIVEARTPATVRQPDIVVIRADAPEPLMARDVVLAIEILSPGSHRRDRVVKRSEYASAGIRHYWIIDLDGPSAEVLTLVDGKYQGAEVTGRTQLDGALPLVVDLSALG